MEWWINKCLKSMASFSFFVSGLVLVCLCLHAFGLKKERKLNLHNDSTLTTIQEEEFVFPTEGSVVDNASQRNSPSKRGGHSNGQSLVEIYTNKELNKMDTSLSSLREQYLSRYHPQDESLKLTSHWATYDSRSRRQDKYYGTKATINVWGHDLKYPSATSAEIWVANIGDGSREHINTIQAGWQVNPSLYNDNHTHFFILWTADGYLKTGCYDLNCPGFVHTNKSQLVPGYKLKPLSSYGGQQYYITLKIYKDPQTGDWLLFEGRGDAPNFIGYWPKSLFNSLANTASLISWGGIATFSQSDKSPPMGSGHFPAEYEGKAASFKNIQYVDGKGDLYDPPHGRQRAYVDKEECYNVGEFRDSNAHGGSDGYVFYYGGPGGCTN